MYVSTQSFIPARANEREQQGLFLISHLSPPCFGAIAPHGIGIIPHTHLDTITIRSQQSIVPQASTSLHHIRHPASSFVVLGDAPAGHFAISLFFTTYSQAWPPNLVQLLHNGCCFKPQLYLPHNTSIFYSKWWVYHRVSFLLTVQNIIVVLLSRSPNLPSCCSPIMRAHILYQDAPLMTKYSSCTCSILRFCHIVRQSSSVKLLFMRSITLCCSTCYIQIYLLSQNLTCQYHYIALDSSFSNRALQIFFSSLTMSHNIPPSPSLLLPASSPLIIFIHPTH